MPRRRASTPVDESTWQGRLRRLAIESQVDAETAAEKLGKASSVTIYEWERAGSGKSPSPDELAVLIQLYGGSADFVLLGDPTGLASPRDRLISQLVAVAEALGESDQRALIALARHFLDARSSSGSHTLTPLPTTSTTTQPSELDGVPEEDRAVAREFLAEQRAREQGSQSEASTRTRSVRKDQPKKGAGER